MSTRLRSRRLDSAAKRTGRRPLIEALVAMGTGTAMPASALGAASYAVTARVQRLLDPADRGCLARYRTGLVAALVVLPALTALVYALAASA